MLSLRNITFSYNRNNSQKNIVKEVSLDVGANEVVGLAGPIGSGKSTLVKLCSGLLKPQEGEVTLNGMPINESKKRNEKKGRIGIVFQYPEDQLFEETIFDDIAFAPRNLGFDKERVEELVVSSTELVGLNKDIYDRSPLSLSGGELRKVAIAGVLAMDPQILILDEPTIGLDPVSKMGIYELIDRFKKLGKTVIFVSHDYEEICKVCSRIIYFDNGKIYFDGKSGDLFKNERLNDSYEYLPTAIKLKKELSKVGLQMKFDGIELKDVTEAIKRDILPLLMHKVKF